jgi:hypothetical protein
MQGWSLWRVWTKTFALLLGFCGLTALAVTPSVFRQGPPQYKVDPSWPKPLPNNWTIGGIAGVTVDSGGHIWIIHRPNTITPDEVGAMQNPPVSICCERAPAVIEFDTEGNVLRAWGGPGWVSDWLAQEHGIAIDKRWECLDRRKWTGWRWGT